MISRQDRHHPDFLRALRNGHDFQSATLVMDTTNNIFVPMFA